MQPIIAASLESEEMMVQALDQRISKSSNMDGIFTVSLDNDFVGANTVMQQERRLLLQIYNS